MKKRYSSLCLAVCVGATLNVACAGPEFSPAFKRLLKNSIQKKTSNYRGVAFGTAVSEAKVALPIVGSEDCRIKIPGGLSEYTSLYKELYGLMNYDQGLREPITKLFETAIFGEHEQSFFSFENVANGCGLFFNGAYIAQINAVSETLNEDIVVAELGKNFGGRKEKMGRVEGRRRGLGDFNLYRWKQKSLEVMLMFYSDRVVTIYSDHDISRSAVREATALSQSYAASAKVKSDGETAAKTTKKILEGL